MSIDAHAGTASATTRLETTTSASASPPRTSAGTSSEPNQRPSGGGVALTSRVADGPAATPLGPGWRLVRPSLSMPSNTKTEFHTLPLVDPSGYGFLLAGVA